MQIDFSELRPCKVCLVPHDDEIHAATLSVREWFHDQVTQGLFDYVEEEYEAAAELACEVA